MIPSQLLERARSTLASRPTIFPTHCYEQEQKNFFLSREEKRSDRGEVVKLFLDDSAMMSCCEK